MRQPLLGAFCVGLELFMELVSIVCPGIFIFEFVRRLRAGGEVQLVYALLIAFYLCILPRWQRYFFKHIWPYLLCSITVNDEGITVTSKKETRFHASWPELLEYECGSYFLVTSGRNWFPFLFFYFSKKRCASPAEIKVFVEEPNQAFITFVLTRKLAAEIDRRLLNTTLKEFQRNGSCLIKTRKVKSTARPSENA